MLLQTKPACRVSAGTDSDEGAGGGQWPGRTRRALGGPAAPFTVPGQGAPTLPLPPRERDPKGRGRDVVVPGKAHLPTSCCARQLEPLALARWGWRSWLAFWMVTRCLQMRM